MDSKRTQIKLLQRYGNPLNNRLAFENTHMVLWDVPNAINTHIAPLPNKIYCNKDIVKPLLNVFNDLMKSHWYYSQIITWDGCFNIRMMKGSNRYLSLHSWGLAVDLNAAHNPFGLSRDQCIARGLKPFTKEFCDIWQDNDFTVGFNFKRPDGMHFEFTSHLL